MTTLGILVAGLDGAVATTLAAGLALLRHSPEPPTALISEAFVASHQLARLDQIVCAGWDPRGEDVFTAAQRHGVISRDRLRPVARSLAALRPWRPSARQLPRDIDRFRRQHRLADVVVLNLLPTGEHRASQHYARAAAATGCPFINFTPNDCGEARLTTVPYAGRDGKTGQTWFKSVLAPALQARGLKITGWYSTNLLGNEDGKVVGDPVKGAAKIRDKSKLLGELLGYAPFHTVQINYYPPRGDNKESWDNIDFEGFLGLPMQIKVNQLYRDSILAAPMCLDLARFLSLAQRRGAVGPQTWLSLYFKAPYGTTVHDFFQQERLLRQYLERGRG